MFCSDGERSGSILSIHRSAQHGISVDDLLENGVYHTFLTQNGLLPSQLLGGATESNYICSVLQAIYDGAQTLIAANPGLDPQAAAAMAEVAVAANPPATVGSLPQNTVSWNDFLHQQYETGSGTHSSPYPAALNQIISSLVQIQYGSSDVYTAINTILTQHPSITATDLFNNLDGWEWNSLRASWETFCKSLDTPVVVSFI